jgi:hypothetical protein
MFLFIIFQKEWLDKFEQAKKARLAQDQLKRESTNITERSPSRPSHSESLESPSNREFLGIWKCSTFSLTTPHTREILFYYSNYFLQILFYETDTE